CIHDTGHPYDLRIDLGEFVLRGRLGRSALIGLLALLGGSIVPGLLTADLLLTWGQAAPPRPGALIDLLEDIAAPLLQAVTLLGGEPALKLLLALVEDLLDRVDVRLGGLPGVGVLLTSVAELGLVALEVCGNRVHHLRLAGELLGRADKILESLEITRCATAGGRLVVLRAHRISLPRLPPL